MGLVCGLAVEDDGGGGVIAVLLVVWRLMGTSVPDGCFGSPLLLEEVADGSGGSTPFWYLFRSLVCCSFLALSFLVAGG